MDLKYSFTSCLDPRKVKNPYTGEELIVPCGKCKACLTRKTNRNAFLCDLESQGHQYCVFVTLTYANRWIPKADVYEIEETRYSDVRHYQLVDSKTRIVLNDFYETKDYMNELLQKCNYEKIPYLRKTDLQKWLKRFRKEARKYSQDAVRYYAVGEYGPVHFRPHYHLLLWFEDPKLLKVCESLIYKTWKYGRIDCQLSKGKASSYVASYVNSYVLIPKVYKDRSLCPFSVHSQFLGQKFLKSQRSAVYAQTPEQFVKRGVVRNGSLVEFQLWSSVYRSYYPKCRAFDREDVYGLYQRYSLYEAAIQRSSYCESTFDLAKALFDLVLKLYKSTNHFKKKPDELKTNVIESYLYDLLTPYFKTSSEYITEEKDKVISNIYRDLLLSKHFLEFVCDGIKDYGYRLHKIQMIKDFYSELERMHLRDWYTAQAQWSASDLIESEELMYFYDDTLAGFKDTRVYKVFYDERQRIFDDKIKHKKLNDLNRIFLETEPDYIPF